MLRSALSNWMGLLVVGVTTFILTPIFIHAIGDFYFGMWALVSSFFTCYGLLDMGLRPTVQRFVARLKGAKEREALDETLSTAVGISLVLSLLVCALTAVLVALLPTFFGLAGESRRLFGWLLIIVGLDVAASFPSRLLGTCLIGFQRFDLYNLATIVVTVTRAVLQVIALHLGFGVMGIAVVSLWMELLLIPIHWWMLRYVDSGISLTLRKMRWDRTKELSSFGFYAFLSNLGDYLRFSTDSVVIGRVLAMALITPFSVAGRLMGYFRMGLIALVSPSAPRMSELEGQGKTVELQEIFLFATRIAALFSLFVGCLFFFNGKALLRLWVGERFVSSYGLLMVLTVGYVVALTQWPSSALLYAKARHQALGWWTLVEGVANIGLSIYWGRKYGLIGVALGTTVPMLVTNLLVLPAYVLRQLGMKPARYILEALARPVLASGLFFALYLLFPSDRAQPGILSLGLNVGLQFLLFALLAYTIGLASSERLAVVQRFMSWTGLTSRQART